VAYANLDVGENFVNTLACEPFTSADQFIGSFIHSSRRPWSACTRQVSRDDDTGQMEWNGDP